MNKKRNKLFIFLLVLILVILGFIIVYFVKDLIFPSEEKVVNKLTSMGEEIYNDYYYPSISEGKSDEEIKNFLKPYEELGLKFNLNELEKYNDDFKESITKFKSSSKSCDKENTMVIIYPKSPYGKTDFTTSVKLECGFKK